MRIWHFIIFLFFTAASTAQTDIQWRKWGPAQGFPAPSPQVYFQDSYGYLWIGTVKGVFRFNGRTFEHFAKQDGLTRNLVSSITEDTTLNLIWAVSPAGASKYDGISFTEAEFEDGYEKLNFLNAFYDPDQRVTYFGARDGLHIYENGKIKNIAERTNTKNVIVKAYCPEVPGSLLLGSKHGAMRLINGTEPNLLQLLLGKNIRKIKKAPDGKIWMLESFYNLCLFESDTLRCDTLQQFITDFFFDNDGNIITSHSNEISIFTIGDAGIQMQESINNFPKDPLAPLGFPFVDLEGTIWVGSEGSLLQSTEKHFENFKCKEGDAGCANIVSYLANIDGQILVGNEDQIQVVKGDHMELFFGKIPAATSAATSIIEDKDGAIWVSYGLGGLLKYDGKTEKRFATKGSIHDMQYVCIFRDAYDILWAGGIENILKIDGESIEKLVPEALSLRSATTINQDQYGRMWVGSAHGGLFCADVPGSDFDDFNLIDFEDIPITHIDRLGEDFWLVTDGKGIIKGTPTSDGKFSEVQHFDRSTGFPVTLIQDIVFDYLGRMWLASYNQILCLDPTQNLAVVHRFTLNDGYAPYHHSYQGLLIDSLNHLWIGSQSGLQRLDLNKLKIDKNPPRLHLKNILLFNEPIQSSKEQALAGYGEFPRNLKLSPRENYLSFEYDGIFLKNPEEVRYRTRMKGLQSDWSKWKTENIQHFNSLPGGDYTFEVQARNGDGILSETLSYPISIREPLVRRPWFLLLLLLGGMGLSALISAIRVRSVRRTERKRTEVNTRLARLEVEALRAKMNPHFIFNALNSIQHLIIEGNEEGALTYLSKFSKLIRKVLDKASESKIKLDEEIEMLRNYIELEALRFDHQFEYEINVPETLHDIEIPYLLIQPFVENAIQHGLIPKKGKGQLFVEAFEENDSLNVIVQDNGIGRNASSILKKDRLDHRSQGISVTESRLRLVQNSSKEGQIKIIDLIDGDQKPTGTRVEIQIPLQAG